MLYEVITPTFDTSLVDKERHAVDSEYKLKLKDDVRRCYQVQKETVNPAHPFAKFSVGNLQTLAERDGSPLRDELIGFYQRHYSADRMTLALQSRASLDQLEQWARDYFSAIVNRQLGPVQLEVPLFRPQDLGLRIQIEPVKESRKLTASFALPNRITSYNVCYTKLLRPVT